MVSSGFKPECEDAAAAAPEDALRPQRSRRPRRRDLRCPVHAETALTGTGRKYFLHLLTPEELKQRGLSDKRAKLAIQAHPVLVLSNEWLEQLWCPDCDQKRWCHVIRLDGLQHAVRWAPRELWQQVAHVDPVVANPSVSEFSRREARRQRQRRPDGRRFAESPARGSC
jgi:hypothetical protein